jgi:integrase
VAGKWTTAAPGIRFREHESRKRGVRPDRYFTLRISVGGRQIEEALGWASEGWTVKRAQEELGRLREAARTGVGPATLREKRQAERRRIADETVRARQERTVAELWDRYNKEVVAVENKARTMAEKTRMWERRVKPVIGALKINDVSEQDITTVVQMPLRLDAAGRLTIGRAEAANLFRTLRHMFNKSLIWGLRLKQLGNPAANVSEPKVPRRERLLTPGEVGALQRALDEASMARTEQPQVIRVIRAVILTGGRISELLTLEWTHIRPAEMELHLPDTKTGFSRRPMSTATLELLNGVERMPGVPFVFRSPKEPTRPLCYSTVHKTFRRVAKAAGVKDCTLHTLRHWFVTGTANTVSNPRIGMAVSGHKSHEAYLRYVHGDKEQARELAEKMAEFASGLAAAGPNVTLLRKSESA